MARRLEDIKPGDTWSCPLCQRHVTLYATGNTKGSLRPHKAGAASQYPEGSACDGAGFSPFRRAFPQDVRMHGREEAIRRVRHGNGDPGWEPKHYAPGDLQKFVLDAWPQAGSFTLVGRDEKRGIVFTHGNRKWRYATHNGDFSQVYPFQVEALDAFDQQNKEN